MSVILLVQICLSASNEIKGKSEVLGQKYSSCKLLTDTVIQDCVCVTVCACVRTDIDLLGLDRFHYVNNKAEGARDRYMVGARQGGILH